MGGNKLVIGVLGLQGAFEEHMLQVEKAGAVAIVIKRPEQLAGLDGFIIPGGESTSIRRLMDRYGFREPIREFVNRQKPVFGTCAGMVLAANQISGEGESYLGLMDITVRRNGFGRQKESFEAVLNIEGMMAPFKGIFIRAPFAVKAGSKVQVLAKYEDKIVAARYENILVSSFHPELGDDIRFLQLFLAMVEESKARKANIVEETVHSIKKVNSKLFT